VVDGQDISARLFGSREVEPAKNARPIDEHRTLYLLYGLNKNRLEAVRSGSWKLHLAQPVQLYNLASDLGESHNVAAEHPEVVQQLTRLAAQFAK
jgi:hypothetical protein